MDEVNGMKEIRSVLLFVSRRTVQQISYKQYFFPRKRDKMADFDVLLTVHLSIFMLVINQLDAQNLFYNKFILCLYMFRATRAHRQEVKIVLYNFYFLTMSTCCSKHVEA